MTDVSFHSPDNPLNARLLDFARLHMGSRVEVEDFSRDFGRPSVVWRLTGTDGTRVWLKRHESSRHLRRELLGLQRIVPALGVQDWWSSPTLIASDDATGCILMTEVIGELMTEASVSAEEERTAYALAGQFARKLHGLSGIHADEGSISFRDRLEHYLAAGLETVDDETAGWTRDLIDRACARGPAHPVPCHRDFSPRNWLMQRTVSGIRFGIIDWERGGADVWLQDVQRMAYDHWHRNPTLRDAFFEGYGRTPTDIERLQLDAICLVGAIASIAWAESHNDPTFAEVSRDIITRIRARHQDLP